MSNNPMFRSSWSESVFQYKFAHEGCETWAKLADVLVEDVIGDRLPEDDKSELKRYIRELKFVPGGRYLYYAGRPVKYFNNCYLLKAEDDTREDWAQLSWKAENCLMTGGGIGVDYSIYRDSTKILGRTGGKASGPIPKMYMTNEIGRNVMQGASRRSAIYASLNWKHGDIRAFLRAKNWHEMPIPGTNITVADARAIDFNFPAPLDMTNISVNYDTDWYMRFSETGDVGEVFLENCRQALSTAEPGLSFNFFDKEFETLRNAPVAASTYVLTDRGYQQVGNIVDSNVVVWTGYQWAPTIFKKTKSNVPTIRIEFTGNRSITCDPEHEFFVRKYTGKGEHRQCEVTKVRADELIVGDYLDVSLPQEPREEFDKTSYTNGFLVGDGSNGNSGSEVTLCTPEKKILAQWFVGVCSKTLNDSRGYDRYYFDGPFEMEPTTSLPSFLAGWFDADGSLDHERKMIRITGERSEMDRCRRYLETLGIVCSMSKRLRSGYKGFEGEDTRTLIVLADYVQRFVEVIPCKRLQLHLLKDYVPYRRSEISVTGVFSSNSQDVFCCDVGVREHSFVAEGVRISNCCEVTSEDDSDVCNLGSINMGRVESIQEMKAVVDLATKFLVCGTLVADLPYPKVAEVREKNRRLGLGLMGLHEWLIQRGYRYEVPYELHQWLRVYRGVSTTVADKFCDSLGISRCVAKRSIAPTGTIGILAGTSTGIEPIFAVAYLRRYLKGTHNWCHQYVVDSTAQELIDIYGTDPDEIETALALSADYERRIRFQAVVQQYVDQAISSTINLPAWGSEHNNEDSVQQFAETLAHYAPRLRGFTCYPEGARGGQPLTPVPYLEAKEQLGVEFESSDICAISGKGGTCGA